MWVIKIRIYNKCVQDLEESPPKRRENSLSSSVEAASRLVVAASGGGDLCMVVFRITGTYLVVSTLG